MVERLWLTSAGSPYISLGLGRLAVLAERTPSGEEVSLPLNNLRREFQVIQRRARARLARQREVDLMKVSWPIGTIHYLRKPNATQMKRRVSPAVLKKLMGHADIRSVGDRSRQSLDQLEQSGDRGR